MQTTMKKLLIFLLILTSCAKSKQAIEAVQTFEPSDSLPIIQTCEIEPKTRLEIRLEKRNERVETKEKGKTDRRKSKDARKNHKQDVKLAVVESKQETKQVKSNNKNEVDSLAKVNKGANIAKKVKRIDKQIINAETKVDKLKQWKQIIGFCLMVVIIIIIFFLFLYLKA